MQDPSDMATPIGGIMPDLNIQPRVYVRKMGGEYVEIAGINSFERSDHGNSLGEISFVMADKQDNALMKLLQSKVTDKHVDVKMEFLIGMLMVMSFSGFVEHFSGDKIVFSVSTPIATDVHDVAH